MEQELQLALRAGPKDWLLDPSNPSVRYFTIRDILEYSEDHPELHALKKAIPNDSKVVRIFQRQHVEGFWESADHPYMPKYKSSYWQIMILSQLGLDRTNLHVSRAVEYISQFQMDDGGFTAFRESGARQKYQQVLNQARSRAKELPPFGTWAAGKIRENEMSCLTGNTAAALIRLGYAHDDRVQWALKWLVDVQNADGGWLCPYWKAHLRDTHGCFMGTITPLDAFAELPREQWNPSIRRAAERGAEFLLMHRLFKADHHQFRVINKNWLNFGFPWFFYDILRGLSVLTSLGYGQDERLDDALKILLQKQQTDGTWILERTPSGRMQTNLEPKGKPSKWITLHALKVLKKVIKARST